MMRKLSICLVIAVLFVVWGCGSAKSGLSETAEGADSAAEIAAATDEDGASTGDTALTVLLYHGVDDLGERQWAVYEKTKQLFEKENPGVTVNLVGAYSSEDYYTTYRSGLEPDILEFYQTDIGEMRDSGLLTDLKAFMDQDGLNEQEYYSDGLLSLFRSESQLLGLPYYMTTPIIAYNKSLFDRAGLSYPTSDWTRDQFAAAAAKLKGVIPNGVLYPFDFSLIEPLVISNGGSYLSPDGTTAIGYLDGDPSVEAFRWLQSLIGSGTVTLSPWEDSLLDVKKVSEGSAGMIATYSYNLSNIEPGLRSQVGVVGFPSFRSGEKANIALIGGIGIGSQSKNPGLAWKFLKTLVLEDSDRTRELFSLGAVANKKIKVQLDPIMEGILGQQNDIRQSARDLNRKWGDLGWNVYNQAEPILSQKKDAKSVLSSIAADIDDPLKFKERLFSAE